MRLLFQVEYSHRYLIMLGVNKCFSQRIPPEGRDALFGSRRYHLSLAVRGFILAGINISEKGGTVTDMLAKQC